MSMRPFPGRAARFWIGFAVAGVLAAGACPALAGFPGEVRDHVQLQVGGSFTSFDTSVGLGLQGGRVGTILVFEDLFDLPVSKSVWEAEGRWAFGERHNLDFGYVTYNRENAHELARNIDFGEYTFLAGSRVTAEFDTRFFYTAYRYDFLELPQVKIGGTAGLSWMSLGASLRADAGIVDSTGATLQRTAEVGDDVKFPVPLIGLQVDWAVSQRGAIEFFDRFFYIKTGTMRGGMMQSTLRYFFYPKPFLGLGAGIDRLSIDIPEIESRQYVVRAGYSVWGLSLYLRYGF